MILNRYPFFLVLFFFPSLYFSWVFFLRSAFLHALHFEEYPTLAELFTTISWWHNLHSLRFSNTVFKTLNTVLKCLLLKYFPGIPSTAVLRFFCFVVKHSFDCFNFRLVSICS